MKVWRLETTYACAVIFVDDEGKITDSAPIYRWMVGKNFDNIINHLKHKKQYVGKVELK